LPFRACLDLANTEVPASPDGALAVVITPWTSTGFHRDGAPFDRPDRATIALARQPDGSWLGVPQESFGNHPVKAH
jgi:ketosteroid isomerase-like protein